MFAASSDAANVGLTVKGSCMKTLETVLAQMSDLYEFNTKLNLYALQKQEQEGESFSSESDDPAHALRRDVADEEGKIRSFPFS